MVANRNRINRDTCVLEAVSPWPNVYCVVGGGGGSVPSKYVLPFSAASVHVQPTIDQLKQLLLLQVIMQVINSGRKNWNLCDWSL